MLLYLIRHADPDYEHDSLTEKGWKEAQALAEWLKDIKIDRIITSPSGRAVDTAKPTLAIKGMTSEVYDWPGESYDYMCSDALNPQTDCEYSFSVREGVHDFRDFDDSDCMDRVDAAMKQADGFLETCGYKRRGIFYDPIRPNDDSIAVFSHRGFGTAWISYLLGIAPGLMWPILVLDPSSITTFEFFIEDDHDFVRPSLRRMNDLTHLYKAGLKTDF